MQESVRLTAPAVPVTGPVLRNVISRPRLMAQLTDASARGRVVLVTAPAGYGKSFAVAAWCQSSREGLAWVNLGHVRDDARGMWNAMVHAVTALVPGEAGTRSRRELEELGSPAVATDVIATRLGDWSRRWSISGTLVVDDLHGVTDARLHAQLLELLATVGDSMRLVFITRHDPPWPLHQMRLDGLVHDVRADTLAFDDDEAERLLRSSSRITLSDGDLAALTRRTEGWAAGLRMAALGLAAAPEPRDFAHRVSGSKGYIADYLMREVYDGFGPRRRQLLRTISVVDRVSADLASFLGAEADCADQLQEMAAENAFVHEIGQLPGWYRLHPLLLDFVRSRITDAQEIAGRRSRAARWFQEQGDPWTALDHAVAAADWELAGEIVIRNVISWVVVQPPAGLGARLNAIPREAVLGTPGLAIGLAGARTMVGSTDDVANLLDAACAALQQTPRQPAAAYQIVIELIQAGRVRWGGGDLEQLADAFGGLDVTTTRLQDASLADWTAIQSLVASNLGACLVWSGDLVEAIPHLRAAADVPDADRLLPALNARAHLAIAYWMRGELNRASTAAQEVITAGSRLGLPLAVQLACAHLARAAVALDRDELGEVDGSLDVARSTAREPHVLFACELLHARALSARGSGYEAATAARDAVAAAPPTLSGFLRARGDYLARVLSSRGAPRAALDLKAPPVDAVDRSSVRYRVHDSLRCVADPHAPYPQRVAALVVALRLAAPERLRRPFLDLQPAVRDVLPDAIENGVDDVPFATDLLARMSSGDGMHENPGVFVPLSARELNILRYLVGSMSTAEIAAALYISVNTVKTHQRAVYQKLGVSGRREAVSRARELDLI